LDSPAGTTEYGRRRLVQIDVRLGGLAAAPDPFPVSNTLKTTLLLGLLTGLLLWAGEALGGSQGLVIALGVAVVINIGSYWFSDRIVLRMYRAQPLEEPQAPELFRMVRELTTAAGLPMPRICLIPTESPNAFATGRDPEHAVVAVTAGLTRLLNREELRGVVAHELGHVHNRDTLISAIAAPLAGVVTMLARVAYWGALFGGRRADDDDGGPLGALLMIIVAPLAALLIQMAISRSREFGADAFAARVTHDPFSLASALEKIAVGGQRVPLPAGPATAHLFIMNPLRGGWLSNLFSTHPPTEERIRHLRSMTV
jgi:heat shock protein HtpX